MNQNIGLCIWFRVYESPEDSRIELQRQIFNKNYSNGTSDLIIEARAYEAQVLIHVDEIQQHPENNVGVDFPNIIQLIKTGKNYDSLKQIIDVDGVPCNDEEKEEKW